MAGGKKAQSRIKWRPYNPNNHIFRTVVCEASREAGQLKPFYTGWVRAWKMGMLKDS
jgi:hypothetical protein